MASGLLAFVNETELVHNSVPQNIACAVVLVALEGVARTPAPGLAEFIDEFAYTVGTKPFSIGERYRQLCCALADYAPRLPWLAGRTFAVGDDNDDNEGSTPAPTTKKRGRPTKTTAVRKATPKRGWKRALVAYTGDIVQWRRSLDAKQRKLAREGQEAMERNEGIQPDADQSSPGEGDDRERHGGGEDGDDEGAYFADPVFSGVSTDMYNLHGGSSASSPSVEASPALPSSPKNGVGDSSAGPTGPPPKRRRKRADFDAGVLGLAGPTPSAAESQDAGLAPAKPVPQIRDEVEMRQLLLAGHGTADVLAHMSARQDQPQKQLIDPAKPSTRLERLQWYKPVEEITADEDLFDEGELDAYIRPKEEVDDLLKLPSTKEMLEAAKARELASEDKPKRDVPVRRWRGRAFSRKVNTNVSEWTPAERAASGYDTGDKFDGFTEIEIGDRGDWGCFGPSHTKRRRQPRKRADTEESDGFTARPKKTKMTAERKQKIEALLAMDGIGESDDEDYGAHSDDEEVWLDQAVQVARHEGEAVDADEEDGSDEEAAAAEPADNWRTQLGYSAEPDEGDYGDRDYDD
jgi:hypothetical protein